MRSISVLSATAVALALTLSVASAQTAPAGNAPAATNSAGTPTTQVSQAPGMSNTMDQGANTAPTTGNSATQGRYYDSEDQYLDPSTGASGPGSPQDKDQSPD